MLGDSGVWNNYTQWVTPVVPLSSRYTTLSLGRVEPGGGTFVFRGVSERVLDTGAEHESRGIATSGRKLRRLGEKAAFAAGFASFPTKGDLFFMLNLAAARHGFAGRHHHF